eukprot:Em0149g1a
MSDALLRQVLKFTKDGWNKAGRVDDQLRPYFNRREELSTEGNCLMWGIKAVIPPGMRQHILKELHQSHPGIVRMKSLARLHVWWPGIDEDIERMVRTCDSCNQQKDNVPHAPLHPWEYPSKPWQRMHDDFAGPFFGKMWLIVVDARTKWPEVFQLNEATSGTTITAFMTTFSRFGLPEIIVTDNGSQFTSDQFKTFCDENGIRHVRVAPYHLSSNGEAERFVKTFKHAFSAMGNEKDPVRRLQQFLFSYRNTPHSTTGVSPAELLVGRQLRGRLDLLRQQTCITNTSHCPNPEVKVQASQRRQKIAYDKHAKQREFTVGQAVWVKGQNHQQNWLPGVIVKQRNSVSYTVNVSGQLWHRHIYHLREREQDETHVQGAEDSEYFPNRQPSSADDQDIITDENAPNLRHEQQPIHDATPQEDQAILPEHTTVEKRRKSTREHRPPVRFHEEFGL